MLPLSSESIEEIVKCGLCLDIFNKPVQLPCTHNFCESCILSVVECERQKNRNAKNILCPICRGSTGFETPFPVNLVVQQVCELLKQQNAQQPLPEISPSIPAQAIESPISQEDDIESTLPAHLEEGVQNTTNYLKDYIAKNMNKPFIYDCELLLNKSKLNPSDTMIMEESLKRIRKLGYAAVWSDNYISFSCINAKEGTEAGLRFAQIKFASEESIKETADRLKKFIAKELNTPFKYDCEYRLERINLNSSNRIVIEKAIDEIRKLGYMVEEFTNRIVFSCLNAPAGTEAEQKFIEIKALSESLDGRVTYKFFLYCSFLSYQKLVPCEYHYIYPIVQNSLIPYEKEVILEALKKIRELGYRADYDRSFISFSCHMAPEGTQAGERFAKIKALSENAVQEVVSNFKTFIDNNSNTPFVFSCLFPLNQKNANSIDRTIIREAVKQIEELGYKVDYESKDITFDCRNAPEGTEAARTCAKIKALSEIAVEEKVNYFKNFIDSNTNTPFRFHCRLALGKTDFNISYIKVTEEAVRRIQDLGYEVKNGSKDIFFDWSKAPRGTEAARTRAKIEALS